MKLPWSELDVDIVVESTGAFPTFEQARTHLAAGAKRVVLTAPAKDDDAADARTVLVGVNLEDLRVSVVSSNGSCTTNSALPVIQVLSDAIGVRKAFLNTVHGYTAAQRLVDGPAEGHDFRRGRAAAANIVPSTTGAAIAVARAIPALRGRFDGTPPACRSSPVRYPRSCSSPPDRRAPTRSTGASRARRDSTAGRECSPSRTTR